jgi:HAD superfamily hydrolase (TIGR01509 family)
MINGVIFDADGTLIDSVDGHAAAWQEILARYGRVVPFEEVRHQIGKGGDQLMPVFLPKEVVERLGEQIERERLELFKAKYLPRVKPFPKVRELFERIRADGRKIVLASSAKGEELRTYKKLARIDDLVEEETSSDDAERSKPHPDIFHAAMAKLRGASPDDAVAVGDTPYDAEAAGKAGLRTIGVLCGGFPEAELREAGCIAIYRDPADLLARYDESPLSPRAGS